MFALIVYAISSDIRCFEFCESTAISIKVVG